MEQDVSKRPLGKKSANLANMFGVSKFLTLTLVALLAATTPGARSASIANGQLFMGLRRELNGIYSSFTTSKSETDLDLGLVYNT